MPATRPIIKRHRRMLLALSAAVPLLALTSCVSPETNNASQASATTSDAITTAWPEDVTNLDPINHQNSEDYAVVRNVYQTLL